MGLFESKAILLLLDIFHNSDKEPLLFNKVDAAISTFCLMSFRRYYIISLKFYDQKVRY